MAKARAARNEADWPLLRPLQGASWGGWGRDLAAGLTLAAIAIPEQMATARLGGLAPQVGLIAFVAATVAFAAFGSNRLLSVGADSTITPIFAGSLALLATTGSPHYATLAAALALMVAVILTLAGLFRLGWVADLLSRPVTTGFLAGISLHIVLSQAPALLGLPEESGDVYHRVGALFGDISAFKPAALGVGLGVFALTYGAEKLNQRIPGALVAMIVATWANVKLGLAKQGLALLGATVGKLPTPALPVLGLHAALPLVGLAFIIALVIMLQTAITSRSYPGRATEPDVDRDFIGLGVANGLAALAGSMPVNASPPRTAAVSAAGGRTGFSGLIAAAAVLLLVLLGSGLLAQTPAAALAGILLFVAQRIFHVDDFRRLFRRTPVEFALAVATMAMIVLLPIQTGVAIGMFLSMVHGVYSITRTRLVPFERAPGSTVWWPVTPERGGETVRGVLVEGFQAPLSFLNAYDFRRDLMRALDQGDDDLRLLVLESSGVVEIDFTAAEILIDVIDVARARGIDVAVARLESVRAQEAFERFGVTDRLGKDHLFQSVEEAIRKLALSSQAGASSPG